MRKCLKGTYSILMDDGLGVPSEIHPYPYHDHFTLAPTKRIVRIETLAETLMEGITKNARPLKTTRLQDSRVLFAIGADWTWSQR